MINLPADTNRLVIVGMTGSGKTHAGLWHLSLRDTTRMPWIILDFKGDDGIAKIPGLEILEMKERVPSKPGIYAYQPIPEVEEDDVRVEAIMWECWRQEYTGIFIDEGYMIPRYSKSLRAVLTQGRSKRVPVIALTQRPVMCPPFLLSESEFLQLYYIHNPRDVKTMREWMPLEFIPNNFHSLYYDVKKNKLTHLGPMPDISEIMQRFDDKRPRRKRPLF